MNQVNNTQAILEVFGTRVPRYTSYPTVPQWKNNISYHDSSDENINWLSYLESFVSGIQSFQQIGLYIHLPFCEDLCTYCGCNKYITKNHSVEGPYIDALIREWDEYLSIPGFKNKIRISYVHLGGGTPTFFNAENLVFLINTIKNSGIISEACQFSFEGHPSNTSNEHLKRLKEVGFDRLSIGIQDFNPKVQFLISRKQTLQDVSKVQNAAKLHQFKSINFDIVYGLPGQSVDSLSNSVKTCIDLKPDRIAYYSYAHVPWKIKGQRRYKESDLPCDQIKDEMFDLGKELFLQAGYHYIGMDHFVLESDSLYDAVSRQRMYRDFMGYSEMKTDGLLGVGCSAISDLGKCYGQNEKDFRVYQDLINSNGSAIVKGHLLRPSEIRTSELIQMIMCCYKIDLNQLTNQQKQQYERYSQVLKDFGLIEESNDMMLITNQGQKYLRSIASIFDPYYDFSETQKLFSKAL